MKPIPSLAAYWSKCASYLDVLDAFPDDNGDTFARDQGTAAHQALWHYLARGEFLTTAYKGIEVDAEMRAAISRTAEEIAQFMPNPAIETEIELGDMYPGMTGKIDIFTHGQNTLHVGEFKYGTHYVPAIANPQLTIYTKKLLEYYPADNITYHVFQPRCYRSATKHSMWIVDRFWVEQEYQNLKAAAIQSQQPLGEKYPTSGNHCANCPALLFCEASTSRLDGVLKVIGVNKFEEDDDTSLAAKFDLLKEAKKQIEAMYAAAEAKVMARLSLNKTVGYYRLDPGVGALKWNKPQDSIKVLEKMYKISVTHEPKLMTPIQIIEKGVPKNIVECYSERTKSVKLSKLDPKEVFNGR